jgi:hypothetical protein
MDEKEAEELIKRFVDGFVQISVCIERLTDVYAPRLPDVKPAYPFTSVGTGDPGDETEVHTANWRTARGL